MVLIFLSSKSNKQNLTNGNATGFFNEASKVGGGLNRWGRNVSRRQDLIAVRNEFPEPRAEAPRENGEYHSAFTRLPVSLPHTHIPAASSRDAFITTRQARNRFFYCDVLKNH